MVWGIPRFVEVENLAFDNAGEVITNWSNNNIGGEEQRMSHSRRSKG